jgi:hypothetical protein
VFEEGKWILTNTSATPQSNACYYIKIGKLVRCSGYFQTHGSTTAATDWGGLPFNPQNTGPSDDGNRGAGGVAYFVSDDNVGILVGTSAPDFRFYASTSVLALAANTHVYFYLTYRAVL